MSIYAFFLLCLTRLCKDSKERLHQNTDIKGFHDRPAVQQSILNTQVELINWEKFSSLFGIKMNFIKRARWFRRYRAFDGSGRVSAIIQPLRRQWRSHLSAVTLSARMFTFCRDIANPCSWNISSLENFYRIRVVETKNPGLSWTGSMPWVATHGS